MESGPVQACTSSPSHVQMLTVVKIGKAGAFMNLLPLWSHLHLTRHAQGGKVSNVLLRHQLPHNDPERPDVGLDGGFLMADDLRRCPQWGPGILCRDDWGNLGGTHARAVKGSRRVT